MKNAKISSISLIAMLPITLLFSQSIAQDYDSKNYIHEKRIALSKQFRKEIVKVAEGVFVAVGYGSSNSVLIEGADSVVIVDAMGGTEEAEHVLAAFRGITDKPIEAIIYTHGHPDHTSGASVFARETNPNIYGGSSRIDALESYGKLGNIRTKRGWRQYGHDLLLEEKVDGLHPVYRPNLIWWIGEKRINPTQIITVERKRLQIAGIILEIVAAPGESDDHLYVWLPKSKVLICGDNFYFSFPNLYTIRGTQYRDVSIWVNSLDKIILEEAEYLISGHARPIMGKENVRTVLTDYRNAIDFVLQETLTGMNQGMTVDELAHSVKLPDSLANKDYLQEFYGVIEWSVRSIYSGYLGWFDGNPTNLFPLSPVEEAIRLVELVGSEEKLIKKAKDALVSENYQWACQLADYILALEPESKEMKLLKAEALIALADQQLSSNAHHYYLSVAKELMEEIK